MRINCMKCQYYYVTWDPARPRGCQFFGFKSYVMPSQVVFKSSGNPCEGFKEKINSNK